MIKAVIFDMDGLIIETESFQSRAYEQILREHGKEPQFEPNGLVHKLGVRGDEVWEMLFQQYGFRDDVEALRERKRTLYVEILKHHLEPMPGLLLLLNLLKEKQVPMAVATGSNRKITTYILEGLGIYNFFTILVTGDEVKKGKPAPEAFLLASQRLGVNPKDCLVLEDAESGVRAAKNAGMHVIGVPSPFTKHHDFSLADKVMNSLAEVTWDVIAAL